MEPSMRTKAFLAGEAATFADAFPTIANITVEVVRGEYYSAGKPVTERYTERTVRPRIACPNPCCRQGGLDIGRLIQYMVWGAETKKELVEFCSGHEGSPNGRRIGRPCDNSWTVTITIAYRDGEKGEKA
jgi:hypothetical protein